MGKGFTLIELLISIGVMAVLSAGVLALIGPSSRQYARDTRRKGDLESIRSALELYRNDNGRYPGPSWKADLTGGTYMSTVPQDPKTTTDYRFTPAPAGCTTGGGTRCTRYTLCADLEKIAGAWDYCVTNP